MRDGRAALCGGVCAGSNVRESAAEREGEAASSRTIRVTGQGLVQGGPVSPLCLFYGALMYCNPVVSHLLRYACDMAPRYAVGMALKPPVIATPLPRAAPCPSMVV